MAKTEYCSLSERIIDRLSVDDKDAVLWDYDLADFVSGSTGKRVYLSQRRAAQRDPDAPVGRRGLRCWRDQVSGRPVNHWEGTSCQASSLRTLPPVGTAF